jgi:CGNR zinc finger
MALRGTRYRLSSAVTKDPLSLALKALKLGDEVSVTTVPRRRNPNAALSNARIILGDKETPPAVKPQRARAPKSERRWLRWLAQLAEESPESLSSRNLDSILRDFAFFAAQWAITDFEATDSFASVDVPSLARELHQGLVQFLTHGEWETPELSGLRLHLTFATRQKRPQATPFGPMREVILFGAIRLLERGGHLLRKCAARECNRVFVANRRQTYCSRRCAEREKLTRFVEDHGGPEGYADYRARKREARIRKRLHGPNLKIKWRTKSK